MSHTNPQTLISDLADLQEELQPMLASVTNIMQSLMIDHGYVMRPNGATGYLVHPQWIDNFDKGWYSKTKNTWHPKLGNVPSEAILLLYT